MQGRSGGARKDGRATRGALTQPPWFLTGVTAPFSRQSMAASGAGTGSSTTLRSDSGLTGNGVGLSAYAAHSADVMSENWLTPRRKLCTPASASALCCWIIAKVSA
jgi:hypothetical protein